MTMSGDKMELKRGKTSRGFNLIEFEDLYHTPCSIQKSSLAMTDAIWIGVDEANPQVLHGDARKLGIETTATCGWVPYPIPKEVVLSTRMHLTRRQVWKLLPILLRFVLTGRVK